MLPAYQGRLQTHGKWATGCVSSILSFGFYLATTGSTRRKFENCGTKELQSHLGTTALPADYCSTPQDGLSHRHTDTRQITILQQEFQEIKALHSSEKHTADRHTLAAVIALGALRGCFG